MTHYKTLQVEQTASKEDIKQSYRRLAKIFHPDIDGGDEAKFKSINEAYSILSNKNKRADYDMSLNFNQFNNFNQHFTERNLNIERVIKINLKDAYFGSIIDMEVYSNDIVQIQIPQGIRDGQKIKVSGRGTQSKLNPYIIGDLYVTVRVEPDSDVKQIDLLDLETSMYVDTFKLFKDVELDVTLWGIGIGKVKLPIGSDITKRIRIKGRGLKHPSFNSIGDLYIRIIPLVPSFDSLPIELQESINNYISEK